MHAILRGKFALLFTALILAFLPSEAGCQGAGGDLPRAIAVEPPGAASVAPERRQALVIGNSAYPRAPLRNPVNDARSVADALRQCGFEVDLATDCTNKQMWDHVRTFGDAIRGGDVALFYYAGHGLQGKDGENYLQPIDADLKDETEIRFQCLSAQLALDKMEMAGTKVSIAILDACRSNPFARGFRSPSEGLAAMRGASGTYIAFATAPHQVAADGAGEHSPFTECLLARMQEPGAPIEMVFKGVRADVYSKTGNAQTPWDHSSLIGDFYFVPSTSSSGSPLPIPPAPPGNADYTETAGGANIRMIWIPGGTFKMGSTESEAFRDEDESPLHPVTLDGFWMAETETTQAQYQAIAGGNPSQFKGSPDLPADSIQWDAAMAFCGKLSSMANGRTYTLPTEAQWEYACRAGSQWPYCFPSAEGQLGDYAWYMDNAGGQSHPVRQKSPNAFGLYDMHGNVYEWCLDAYAESYAGIAQTNPFVANGEYRVFRGGGWRDFALFCRSANRYRSSAEEAGNIMGFRIVCIP